MGGEGAGWEGIGGGETVIGIYYERKKSIFKKERERGHKFGRELGGTWKR